MRVFEKKKGEMKICGRGGERTGKRTEKEDRLENQKIQQEFCKIAVL